MFATSKTQPRLAETITSWPAKLCLKKAKAATTTASALRTSKPTCSINPAE
jgi:hypothetical protein